MHEFDAGFRCELFFRKAQKLCERRIDALEISFERDDAQNVDRRFEQPVELFFGLAALGDVMIQPEHATRFPVRSELSRRGRRNVANLAVRAHDAEVALRLRPRTILEQRMKARVVVGVHGREELREVALRVRRQPPNPQERRRQAAAVFLGEILEVADVRDAIYLIEAPLRVAQFVLKLFLARDVEVRDDRALARGEGARRHHRAKPKPLARRMAAIVDREVRARAPENGNDAGRDRPRIVGFAVRRVDAFAVPQIGLADAERIARIAVVAREGAPSVVDVDDHAVAVENGDCRFVLLRVRRLTDAAHGLVPTCLRELGVRAPSPTLTGGQLQDGCRNARWPPLHAEDRVNAESRFKARCRRIQKNGSAANNAADPVLRLSYCLTRTANRSSTHSAYRRSIACSSGSDGSLLPRDAPRSAWGRRQAFDARRRRPSIARS